MLKGSYKIVLQSKCFACVQKALAICGGLTLTGLQAQQSLSQLPSAGQGREYIKKDSWVEISKGRDHSPVIIVGTIDSALI